MKSKRLTYLISGLVGTIVLAVLLFVLIINLNVDSTFQSNNNNDSNNIQDSPSANTIDVVGTIVDVDSKIISNDNVREADISYVSLNEVTRFFNTEHRVDANKTILTINKDDITFEMDSFKLFYKKKKAHKEKFAIENGEIFVPLSFLEKHYDIHFFETLNGIKLTTFKHVPILLYHTVNDTENNTLNTNPEHFDDHMKHLSLEGYTGISPMELYEFYYGNGILPEKPVFIHFDDGYRDNYTAGFPILQKYNMKATIFIIASRIEHEGNNSYPNEIPKLTWEDAKAMDGLVTIQNHTWDSHRKIKQEHGKDIGQIAAPQLKEDQTFETKEEYIARITNDISQGQNIIKEKLGYESVMFSYPYGEFSEEAIEVATNHGVKLAVSVGQGKPMHVDYLYKINRMVVDGNWSGKELIKHIHKEYH